MKRAFVTGGSGFVGGPLIRRLVARDVAVVALARSEAAAEAVQGLGAEACRGDLFDEAVLEAGIRGCDTVFHVAGHLTDWGPYRDFHQANVVGTSVMLKATRSATVSTFAAVGASAVVMGSPRPMRNISESLPLRRPSWGPYIRSKAEADRLVRSANTSAFRTVVIRPPLIWGPGMPMLNEIEAAARNGQFALPNGGRQIMSTSHVDNVVECLILAAEHGRGGEAYHVTDGEVLMLKDVIAELLATRGTATIQRSVPFGVAWSVAAVMETAWRTLRLRSKPPITRQTLRMIGQDFTLDIAKARRDLGYKPILGWRDGIEFMN